MLGLIGLTLATICLGQSQDVQYATRPEFEVASIKQTGPYDNHVFIRYLPGGGFSAAGTTAGMLIQIAYDVKGSDIVIVVDHI